MPVGSLRFFIRNYTNVTVTYRRLSTGYKIVTQPSSSCSDTHKASEYAGGKATKLYFNQFIKKVHAVKAIINCDWCRVSHVLIACVARARGICARGSAILLFWRRSCESSSPRVNAPPPKKYPGQKSPASYAGYVLRALVFPEWKLTGFGTQKKVPLSHL